MSTDLIVGFPGETEEQYQQSMSLLEELRFDKVHCAAYSTRPGTIAARSMPDDVPSEEKTRRMKAVDELQEGIAREINGQYLEATVEVLVDGRKRGKWQGRTRTDKLVFFSDDADRLGQLVNVQIEKAGPWSLQGVPL